MGKLGSANKPLFKLFLTQKRTALYTFFLKKVFCDIFFVYKLALGVAHKKMRHYSVCCKCILAFTKICINVSTATWKHSHFILIYGCVCITLAINLFFQDTSLLLFIDQRQFVLRMFWDLARYALGNRWGKHKVLEPEYTLPPRRKALAQPFSGLFYEEKIEIFVCTSSPSRRPTRVCNNIVYEGNTIESSKILFLREMLEWTSSAW